MGIRGVCSFIEQVNQEPYRHAFNGKSGAVKKNITVFGESVKMCEREGCLLFICGRVENTARIKEDFGIMDKKEEGILLTFYLEKGEGFIKYLRGSFIIVILDEIERKIHIFTDKEGKRAVYFAGIDGAFVFSDTRGDILRCSLFRAVMDRKCILRLFAIPCGYLGEWIKGIHRIAGNCYATVDENGCFLYTYKTKIQERQSVEIKPEPCLKGDGFLYSLAGRGEIKSLLPPHAVASAVSKGEFNDGHITALMTCKGYEAFMKDKYDFEGFAKEECNSLLCDIDSFPFKTHRELERIENFYVYYNVFLKNASLEAENLCIHYNLKNNTRLFSSENLKTLFKEEKEKRAMAVKNSLYLTQDIRKTVADLCRRKDAPVFELINQALLSQALWDVEECYLLFLLRVNRFLELFRPCQELN